MLVKFPLIPSQTHERWEAGNAITSCRSLQIHGVPRWLSQPAAFYSIQSAESMCSEKDLREQSSGTGRRAGNAVLDMVMSLTTSTERSGGFSLPLIVTRPITVIKIFVVVEGFVLPKVFCRATTSRLFYPSEVKVLPSSPVRNRTRGEPRNDGVFNQPPQGGRSTPTIGQTHTHTP